MTNIMAQIILILILFFNITLKAQVIDESLSSYPPLILKIMDLFPRWQPDLSATEACKLSLTKENLDPDQCRASYKLNIFDSFRSKLFFKFDALGAFNFQKVDFQIQPDLKIRGLLGLHKNQKRPMVIFRMGIHGNRDELLAERYLVKILYEDLGLHVLVLESLTSHGFLVENKEVSVGGFEEGLHTYYILNQIEHHEFSWADQVTSLHLVGLSMGGEGVFLTTYLDEKTQHAIKSVVNFCPVVNLKKDFDRLNEPGIKNVFADFWNSRRLQEITKKDERLKNISLWPMLFDLKPRFANTVFSWLGERRISPLLSIDQFQKKFPEIKLPHEFNQHIQKSHNLFELNNFWNFYENLKTPFTIISTKNDRVVFNDINTDSIRTGQQPGHFDQVKYVDLQGFHCSLAEEYQWPFLVELIKRSLQL